MSKWYLAGPMRGFPQYNYPLFHSAAAWLRANGFEIISPAEMDIESVRNLAMASSDGGEFDRAKAGEKVGGESAGEILARDVRLIHDQIDGGIILLPDWQKSRGAKLEAYVGLMTGKRFMAFEPAIESYPPLPILVTEMPAELVREMLRRNMP